jgi:hypothetical protein
MASVHVKRRDVVTVHIDIDMPPELAEALALIARAGYGENTEPVIVVNVGGNRVGTVNPHARQWRRYAEPEMY